MDKFDRIWISSEQHLESFKILKKNRKILANVLDPKMEDRFYDFPRINVSGTILPVIFENIGKLIITEDGLQFYNSSGDINENEMGINKGDNIFISFDQITEITIKTSKGSFIPYFNNSWIRIIYDMADVTKDILISKSGKGFVMKKIKKKNIEMFTLIKSKINK